MAEAATNKMTPPVSRTDTRLKRREFMSTLLPLPVTEMACCPSSAGVARDNLYSRAWFIRMD
jgi:hypothetical protein